MNGLLALDGCFEILADGTALGCRRQLDASTIKSLTDFSERYAFILLRSPQVGLLDLGQQLYAWLDGQDGQLNALLQKVERPLRFEVCTANKYPSEPEWALLRAPWELLADQHGFLAADVALGFSPMRRIGRKMSGSPLDPYRMGLVFMAASPRGVVELDYESEESAIMAAVGSTKLDLLVEESGNPDELGERLTEYPPMQVLHLCCHGHNAWRHPGEPDEKTRAVLMLETPEGDALPTSAEQLIESLSAHRPRLVFLSACLTAAADNKPGALPGDRAVASPRNKIAHSLAEALVSAGMPAVLGWDGSVADVAATTFAATLYDGLQGRKDLADAIAAARRSLLNAIEDSKRRDWHLARLWLGAQGGGPLVGGHVRRAMMPGTHGRKQFLIKERQQVPVALHEMFVGRRRELQKTLQVLRDGEHVGVLLHGMGRLGKSSLAARIANRRRDLRLAVVYERYGPLDVLTALETALMSNPNARKLLREGIKQVREDPGLLEDVLIDLLCGPCGQRQAEGTPVLLVIDDLEQILHADIQGGRHRLKMHAPVLQAVLNAFDAALDMGLSRLLITSRFPFSLDGLQGQLFELPVPPLSAAAH